MRILIIGGTSGVAIPLIDMLITTGHEVFATARDAAKASHMLLAHPGIAGTFTLDMAGGDGVSNALNTALDTFTPLDRVVVCSGVAGYGPLETVDLATFRRTIEVNVVSCLAVYQAALPFLRASRGRFVYLSSYAGKVPTPFIGAYTASKHALEALGDVMRQEAKLSEVEVSMILPGGIDTAMCSKMLVDIEAELGSLPPEVEQRYGHYYRGHRNLLAGPGKMPPETVAAVVMKAITALAAKPRYIVGDGAQWFIDQKALLEDAAFDSVAEGVLRDAAGLQ